MMNENDRLILLSVSSRPGYNGIYFYNEIFKKLNMNGLYLNCPSQTLIGLRETISFLNVHAASIAAPFKREVLQFLDELTEIARDTHSVNSIKRIDDKLIGHNTDEVGLRFVLKEFLAKKIRPKIMIYGSGGVVPSIVSAIRVLSPNANIYLNSRDRTKGISVCSELNLIFSLDPADKNVDLWVNATPLSLESANQIADMASNADTVFDLPPIQKIYPFETVIKNRRQGFIRGFDFYRAQFLEQFKFYFDFAIDRGTFDEIAQRRGR